MTAFLLGLSTFLLIMVIYGLTLPTSVTFETSIEINAHPDFIYNHLIDFHEFVKWDPWSEKDKNIELNFSDTQKEIGSSFSWKGNRNVGRGSIQIEHLEPSHFVQYKLHFGPNSSASCTFKLIAQESSTLVSWSFLNEVGKNPFYRILGHLFKSLIAKDYSKGLLNLKNHLAHA